MLLDKLLEVLNTLETKDYKENINNGKFKRI